MILKLIISVLLIGLVSAEEYPSAYQEKACREMCPKIEYNPICASDAKTYGNVCYFKCARKYNEYLDFRAFGMCGDVTACSASSKNYGCAQRYYKTIAQLYGEDCAPYACTREAGYYQGKAFN